MRFDGRTYDEMRPFSITTEYVIYPEGSVLVCMGNTRVLCNTTIEEGVPRWIRTQGLPGGWLTAEYSMLPRSTQQRTPRETNGLSGRTQEIRRLIGRCLRSSLHLDRIGERTIILDCDVLQADGGTRTAAITGGYVSLALAIHKLEQRGIIQPGCLYSSVAAVSVGVVNDQPMLDLCYEEDSNADADMNIVMNNFGDFIEIQGTAEKRAFSRSVMDELLNLSSKGIGELFTIQKQVLNSLL